MAVQNKTGLDPEAFKTRLKEHGLKATPQRIAVHEAMLSLVHATADEVAEWISTNRKWVRISSASIYNTLSQLALLGIYSHRLSADNKLHFDVWTSKHLHFYDWETDEFKDVIDEELFDMVESKVKHKRFKGYHVDGVDIQILGHQIRRGGK